MLQQPTLEKLESMRLHGMAQAFREQSNDENTRELSFEERFALLVDRQMTWRCSNTRTCSCADLPA